MSDFDFDISNIFDVRMAQSRSSSPSCVNPTWESRYEELLHWRADKGDTCVPKAEGALGRWVARQRELKRTGKLATEREEKLNAINFVWNTVTAMWEERFQRLGEWRNEHGHCAVPIAQGELGTWVSKQRQLRKRGKLSKEKVDALNSLKFTWSTAEADWEEKFKRLCEWTSEHGHASVPFNEGELGWWVNTQRQCKRKGKLSDSREARLRTLGFVWNPSNSRSKNLSTLGIGSPADTTPATTPEKLDGFLLGNHESCNSITHFLDDPIGDFIDSGSNSPVTSNIVNSSFPMDADVVEDSMTQDINAAMGICGNICRTVEDVQSDGIDSRDTQSSICSESLRAPNGNPLMMAYPMWHPAHLCTPLMGNGTFGEMGIGDEQQLPHIQGDCDVPVTELSSAVQSEADVLEELLTRNIGDACIEGSDHGCILDDVGGLPILMGDESAFCESAF